MKLYSLDSDWDYGDTCTDSTQIAHNNHQAAPVPSLDRQDLDHSLADEQNDASVSLIMDSQSPSSTPGPHTPRSGAEQGAHTPRSGAGSEQGQHTPRSADGSDRKRSSAAGSVNKSPHAHSRYTDPTKLKERQERVRMVRQKQDEERKRKMMEMQEAQRRAQEFRERQQEERRNKILEMRRRDQERRSIVEERRKKALEKENERRREIIKKFQEKEFKLDTTKNKKSTGVVGFGSRAPRAILTEPMDHSKRAASHSSLVRNTTHNLDSPDSDKTLPHRRAISACSLTRNRGSPAEKHGSVPNLHLSPSKRLSASTSLLARKRISEPAALSAAASVSRIPPKVSSEGVRSISPAHKTPPPRRPRSRQSDYMSTEDGRTRGGQRRPRPHSVAGRLTPNYATPTTASDNRLSRSTEKKPKADANSPKNRSKSADTSHKRLDIERSTNRLSQPKTTPNKTTPNKTTTQREPSRNRDSPKVKEAVKVKPTPPSSMHVKGSPVRQTAKKVQIQESPSPAPKSKSSPPRESPIKEHASDKPGKKTAAEKNKRESSLSRSREEKSKEEKDGENAAKSLEEEYKAKLAEKRRQAKEKAEREAEAERQRIEEERLAAEERQRQEEEEQRRLEEEAMRLAAEARQAEEERLRQAIEAEDRRKREEAERIQAEQRAKEEAERKAKEEAEKREKELQERAIKQEIERNERKKRLEMIMKRVKTSSPETVQKNDAAPNKSNSPPQTISPEEKPAEADNAPKFKSPLLQNLLGRKSMPAPSIKITTESAENSAENSSDEVSDITSANVMTSAQPVETGVPEVTPSGDENASISLDSENVVSVGTTGTEESCEKEAGLNEESVSMTTDSVENVAMETTESAVDDSVVSTGKDLNSNTNFDPFATIYDNSDGDSSSLPSSSQNNSLDKPSDSLSASCDTEPQQTQEMAANNPFSNDLVGLIDSSNTRKLDSYSQESSSEVTSESLVDLTGSDSPNLVDFTGSNSTLVDFSSVQKESEKIDDEKDVDTAHFPSSNADLFDKLATDMSTSSDNYTMGDSTHVTMTSQNGAVNVNGHASLSLQPTISTDSSDSPQSVDGQDEQRHVNDSSFEQFIDLGLPNKNVELQSTGSTLTQNEADVINSNNVVEVEPPQSPLIAFEDNAPKMNDPQGIPS